MAMPRYYANDDHYMTEVVAEACAIADTTGDELTPLRRQATRTLTIENLGEFRDLARTAEACGDLWVAARMNLCVAPWFNLDEAEARIALDRLATIAEHLDASSFRFAVHLTTVHRLAADLQLREAIARLEQAMVLADRASPTVGLLAFSNLVWYGQLCGEPAPLKQVASQLASSGRDWGAMTPLALAVQRMPELLTGNVVWDGPDVAVPTGADGMYWVFADILGEDKVAMFPRATSGTPGDLSMGSIRLMSARSAFAQGRFRDAESSTAILVLYRAEARHFFVLMLARCAADAGSYLEAARLLGAVAGTQERFGLPWLPRLLLAARAETESLGREALGDDAFETAWAEGFELDLDDAVAYALRARGQRKRPSTGWDSLTPTELKVVDQVAAGHTNAEIADALLMGRTTVKTHLAHIFTKLHLANRGQLAAEAARRASTTPA
jgi:DNA-binding CsgD family transcriptional regulator